MKKNRPGRRITIYVPAPLRAAMLRCKSNNWSKIACEAFARELHILPATLQDLTAQVRELEAEVWRMKNQYLVRKSVIETQVKPC